MSRRSARVALAASAPAKAGGPSQRASADASAAPFGDGDVEGRDEDAYGDDMEVDENEEDEEQPKPKPKGKGKGKASAKKNLKRKAPGREADADAESKPAGNGQALPPKKKARVTRVKGALKMLLDMPLDIVLEIFSQLRPADLLSLMRTSEDLRAFLRNRQNAAVWKTSRRNIPGLPECPEDLSEPRFANLAFDKFCDYCVKPQGTVITVWIARIKVCKTCLYEEFRSTSYDIGTIRLQFEYPPSLEVQLIKKSGKQRAPMWDTLYHTGTVELLKAALEQADAMENTEREKFLSDTRKAHTIVALHAKECEKAVLAYETQIANERKALILKRKNVFIEHLRGTKWGDEIKLMSESALDALKNLSELNRACEKDLSERVIARLEIDIHDYMVETHRKRLDRERRVITEQKLPIMINFLKNYKFKNLTPAESRRFPNLGNLLHYPSILDAIGNSTFGDVTKTQFDALIPKLPDIVVDVQKKIKEDLVKLVAAAYKGRGLKDADGETLLNLATTLFSCSVCWNVRHSDTAFLSEMIRYPRVMVHACATQFRHDTEKEESFRRVGVQSQATKWNRHKVISLKKANMDLLREVVVLCGFDPNTTTAAEMDAADPILECVECHQRWKGRATMRWSIVPAHYRDKHAASNKDDNDRPMTLELLNEKDAQAARIRMNEAEDIVRASGEAAYSRQINCMICARCNTEEPKSTQSIEDHLEWKHKIRHPTEDDILPAPDAPNVQNVFRLWPPRGKTRSASETGEISSPEPDSDSD